MKTYLPAESEIERKWYVVDAEGQRLGRLAVKIANILRGRHKAMYTPHIDTGDFVIVVNADKVALSGRKEERKIYQDYSGHMSGLKLSTAHEVRQKDPTRLIKQAVRGMMPNSRLGRQQLRKLKAYAGPNHEHAAQQPVVLEV